MFPDIDDPDMDLSSSVKETAPPAPAEVGDDAQMMQAVIENDDNVKDDGKLISDVLNQGFSSFVPDMMFDTLTKDFAMAKNIYGERMLRLVSGYDADYIKKNLKIPEFQRDIKEKIKKKAEQLKDDGYIDRDGRLTKKAVTLASLVMYTEELDNLVPKGILGEKITKERSRAGTHSNYRAFRKDDHYRDIAIRRSLRTAIRRGHQEVKMDDLQAQELTSKGSIYVIYGMDTSGSMKGRKIEAAKKAGIALAFKAIERKDHVGLIVFDTEIKETLNPTRNFSSLLHSIVKATASRQTNIAKTIRASIDMFPKKKVTKHLLLLTDAVPTVGQEPQLQALEAISMAKDAGVTVSIVGIDLDPEAVEFAEKMAKTGQGKLYIIKDLQDLDKIILYDYYSL